MVWKATSKAIQHTRHTPLQLARIEANQSVVCPCQRYRLLQDTLPWDFWFLDFQCLFLVLVVRKMTHVQGSQWLGIVSKVPSFFPLESTFFLVTKRILDWKSGEAGCFFFRIGQYNTNRQCNTNSSKPFLGQVFSMLSAPLVELEMFVQVHSSFSSILKSSAVLFWWWHDGCCYCNVPFVILFRHHQFKWRKTVRVLTECSTQSQKHEQEV